MLESLIHIADRMDRIGFYRTASKIDSCIRKIASNDTTVVYNDIAPNWTERGSRLLNDDPEHIAKEGLEKVDEILKSVNEHELEKSLTKRWGYEPEEAREEDPFFIHIKEYKQKNDAAEGEGEATKANDNVEKFVEGAAAITSLEYHNLTNPIKKKYFPSRRKFEEYLGELGESIAKIYDLGYFEKRTNNKRV